MNWTNQHMDITTTVGFPYKLHYFYAGDKKIIDVSVGCFCTEYAYTQDGVDLVYTAQIAPMAVSNYPYTTTKSVVVTYEDYSTDNLTFTATVDNGSN